MPEGRLHTRAGLLLSGAFLFSPVYADISVGNALQMTAGALIGIVVSPDLDVYGGNISSFYVRRASPILERAWALYWQPYRWLIGLITAGNGVMDSHRSPWSHMPAVGTAIRLAWALLPAWIILYPLCGLWLPPPLIVCGILAQDFLHVIMDGIIWTRR